MDGENPKRLPGHFLPTGKPPINFGKLTNQQIAFLECQPWHLEAWPGDEQRVRVVYPQLQAHGRWFSTEWDPVPWEFIRPEDR